MELILQGVCKIVFSSPFLDGVEGDHTTTIDTIAKEYTFTTTKIAPKKLKIICEVNKRRINLVITRSIILALRLKQQFARLPFSYLFRLPRFDI